MSFNENVQINAGRARGGGGGFGGRGAAIGGGGGLLALLLAIFAPGLAEDLGIGADSTSGSPYGQYQQQAPGGGTQPVSAEECSTGADANRNTDCRVIATTESADAFWGDYMGQFDTIDWRQPDLTLFTGSVNTGGCGSATSATGPFYCPADESMYFDTDFFATLSSDFGATGGPLAEQYIVAHEYGHHVQNVVGWLRYSQDGQTGADSNIVRSELQADCLAGMWAGQATQTVDPESGEPFLKPISRDQLAQAIDAAGAVGDDRIQEQYQGRVNPEAFTHGSSAQRQAWFMRGYETARQSPDINQCNTFQAETLDI